MQVFSDNKEDFIPLVNLLGVFFQIRDDLMNISDADVCHVDYCTFPVDCSTQPTCLIALLQCSTFKARASART